MKPPRKTPLSQTGAALLIALAIIALASFIALQMTQRLQLDLARTTTISRNTTADEYARGLEFMARRQLRDDLVNDPETDSWQDHWAQPLPPLPVPGGSVTGRLFDLSGRFNLNWLVNNGQVDGESLAMFQRLLATLALDANLADRVVDWLDSDPLPRGDGAEDSAYANQQPAYRSANQAFLHISELRLVAGVDNNVYQRLEPHVAALPANANGRRLNVNTASVEVLMALDPVLTRQRAQRLYENGQARHNSVGAFLQHPALSGLDLSHLQNRVDVRSSHFLAVAQVVIDHIPRRYFILLEREGNSYHVRYRGYGA